MTGTDEDGDTQAASTEPSRRALITLGWSAGGGVGMTLNYAGFMILGDGPWVAPGTFVLFSVGAFGGMAAAERLGPRWIRGLGLVAGVFLSLGIILTVSALAH